MGELSAPLEVNSLEGVENDAVKTYSRSLQRQSSHSEIGHSTLCDQWLVESPASYNEHTRWRQRVPSSYILNTARYSPSTGLRLHRLSNISRVDGKAGVKSAKAPNRDSIGRFI